jgi:H+/Cl- antiporter ClcA
VTLHCGYRGGFIFPLFFVGAAIGLAISLATHGMVSPVVAVLCLMGAVNVAVTKTPIATTIILATLSGTAMLPVLAAACFTSFVLTTQINLIATQRGRREPTSAPASAAGAVLSLPH